MGENYFNRTKIMEVFYNNPERYNGVYITIKSWYNISVLKGNFYNDVIEKTGLNRPGLPKLKADGLILQPFDKPYVPFRSWADPDNIQFKWKPKDLLTMDFQIKKITPLKWELLTFSKNEAHNFTLTSGEKAECIIKNNEDIKDIKDIKDGSIMEFKYIKSFKPYKLRPDKISPNSYLTVMSTISAIDNFFELNEYSDEIQLANTKTLDKKQQTKVLNCYPKLKLLSCSDCYDLTFDEKDQEAITTIINQYEHENKNEFEFELRILSKSGKKDKKREIGISKSDFFYLLSFFKLKFGSIPLFERTIDIKNTDNNLRSTYQSKEIINDSDDPRFETTLKLGPLIESVNKESLSSVKIETNFLNIKIDLSKEEKTGEQSTPINKRGYGNLLRYKLRKSYYIGSWRVDFTIVKSDYSMDKLFDVNEKYELECEYIGKEKLTIKKVQDIYNFIIYNYNYCFKDSKS
jgi:hypothetical protein